MNALYLTYGYLRSGISSLGFGQRRMPPLESICRIYNYVSRAVGVGYSSNGRSPITHNEHSDSDIWATLEG